MCKGFSAKKTPSITTQIGSDGCVNNRKEYDAETTAFSSTHNFYNKQPGDKVVELKTNVLAGYNYNYCLKCSPNVGTDYTHVIRIK